MKAVNLIPSDDRGGAVITAGRSGGGIFVIAGLLAGLVLLALLYGLADHQISHDSTEVASLTARAQQAQERAGELAPYTSFLQMREQRVQAVTALVDSRFDWAQAFHELGRVLPAGKVSLGSIEGTIGSTTAATPAASATHSAAATSAAAVTSATPPGSIPVFKLTGCAVNQAEVALMLQRLRLIDGVSEVSLQSSTQTPGSSSSGGGGGSGCAAGNPAFTAQLTFDALPAVPAPSSSTSTSTVASTSTAASATSAATTTSTAATSASSSGATTPAAGAASTSSSEAVR